MRRPLTYVALALMLLGAEVATGAVSIGAVRLVGGLSAALSGDPYVISLPRWAGGVGILLGGAALFAVLVWAETERRSIHVEGSSCPQCGNPTKRVRRRNRHRILSRLLETSVKRRLCETCGWNGLAA